jgi:hypothetical protein
MTTLILAVLLALPGQLRITTTALPTAFIGIPYSFQMNATGGTPPYHWAITSGALPLGLTLSDSGLISGTVSALVPPQNLRVTIAGQQISMVIKRA